MRRQQRLDLVEQFRARQQVEERIRIAVVGMTANSSLLLRARATASDAFGLAPRVMRWVFGNSTLSLESAFLYVTSAA